MYLCTPVYIYRAYGIYYHVRLKEKKPLKKRHNEEVILKQATSYWKKYISMEYK